MRRVRTVLERWSATIRPRTNRRTDAQRTDEPTCDEPTCDECDVDHGPSTMRRYWTRLICAQLEAGERYVVVVAATTSAAIQA